MIIEQLKKQDNFTESEKVIADCILSKGEEVGLLSIQDLSSLCFCAPTAIMRLCKKIGCDGFKDFKLKYVKELQTEIDPLLDVNRPFYLGESTSKIAKSMYDLSTTAMETCMQSLSYKTLDAAATKLANAKVIYFYGSGASSVRARSIMNKLHKIDKLCVLTSAQQDEFEMSNMVTPEDVAFFISYRGGSQVLNRLSKIIKKRNCPIIVLSSDHKTPLTDIADDWISIPDKEELSDTMGSFYSHICFDFILNILYSVVYSKNYTANHQHKKVIDTYASEEKV